METTLITVHCKLFQMMPYIIITESQKVSSAYCKPFQHSKEKTCRGGTMCLPSLNRVKYAHHRPVDVIIRRSNAAQSEAHLKHRPKRHSTGQATERLQAKGQQYRPTNTIQCRLPALPNLLHGRRSCPSSRCKSPPTPYTQPTPQVCPSPHCTPKTQLFDAKERRIRRLMNKLIWSESSTLDSTCAASL